MRRLLMLGCVLGMLLALPGAAQADREPFNSYGHPTLEAINDAYVKGQIDETEALLYRFFFVKDPERIPAELRREGAPIKSATGILLEVYDRYRSFPAEVRELIDDYRYRPGGLPNTIQTTHFIIHYTTTGTDACSESYAQSVADACEISYTAFHNTLTWDLVPGDGGLGGGTDLIDCYIHNLGATTLGMAEPENPVTTTPEPYDHTGFFHVNNTISSSTTRACTAAHEYMHVVQFGYFGYSAFTWFFENCAMMGEEWAFDAYNDYIGYLSGFFAVPYKSIKTFNGLYEYGGIVWPMYMTEKYDAELVELIYDDAQWTGNIWDSYDNVFPTYGTNMIDSYTEMMRWCWYTRLRDDGNHYEEAGTWFVMLNGDMTYSTYPTGELHPRSNMWPEPYGTSLKKFSRDTGSSDNMLVIDYDGHECTGGVDFLCKQDGADVFFEYRMTLDANGDGTLEIPDWDTMEYGMTMAHMDRLCMTPKDYAMWVDTTVGTSSVPEMGPVVRVYPNRPNPFANYTMIAYSLGQAGQVDIQVVDASGRVVRDLYAGPQHVGDYEIAWDGRDNAGTPVANGVYFARLSTSDGETIREMTVVR